MGNENLMRADAFKHFSFQAFFALSNTLVA